MASFFNPGQLVISQLVRQDGGTNFKQSTFDKLTIPTQNQILSMFQKNGFRSNNIVTRAQLKQLFDRQYATNNMDQVGQQSIFSEQLFDQLWGHLQLMSDSTAKIQNISKVIYDALSQLQKKLKLINGSQGLKHKQKTLKQLTNKQKQLNSQLDQIDAQYNYHQQKIKSQRNITRINIGKLKSQIDQILRDKISFQHQLKILIITIGQHAPAPIQTKIMMDGLMSMAGLQRKQKSNSLKFIFILTIICISIQLFALSYKNSFFNLLGLSSLLYVLFCGYYTDKSVLYLILYFIFSILLDLGFVYLNMFSLLILSPLIFTFNTFLKYIGIICILVTIVGRVILIIKLFSYKQIPKNLQYFQFWGQEVVLNRRNKQYDLKNYNSRI